VCCSLLSLVLFGEKDENTQAPGWFLLLYADESQFFSLCAGVGEHWFHLKTDARMRCPRVIHQRSLASE
jgi:hypothetical protein